MSLTVEQETLAARVEAILVQKDANGEFVYTQDEVRDFIVICIFEMDLPVTPDLEKVLLKFTAQFELPEDITNEQMVEVMREYFAEKPIHPDILKEFQELGRSVLLSRDEGYKDASEKLNTLQATGKEDSLNTAPKKDPAKKADVKPKRGLS